MTPHELTQIRTMISEAVTTAVKKEIALAVQPLQDQIQELQGVDKRHDTDLRKHSGAHKDLAKNVRESLDETKTVTLERVDAKLDDFRVEMLEAHKKMASTPAAAEGAKSAALLASTAAASAAVDTTQIRSNQDKQAHREAIRFYVLLVIVPAAVAIIDALRH